jgi:spectinomycin phosphotransferase/16S rRNA (guanine(1405)-N(7))-methyltransferase
VFTQPPELPDAAVADALLAGWELSVSTLGYLAVGFGSHHWLATDINGARWFVTIDDLVAKRESIDETEGVTFERLRAALATARALNDSGAAFVVAPIPALDGAIVRRVSGRFAVALYPYIEGTTRRGNYEASSDRLAVCDLIVAIHSTETPSNDTIHDDFALANRDALEQALGDLSRSWDLGPYSDRARALLSDHANGVERLLAHYDRLADAARARPDHTVVTHGEPHIENVIFTTTGPVLVDWNTALIAPPERDLWMLESGDGAISGAYTDATRIPVLSSMLDLYRLRWDLAEIAVYIAQFRDPHTETADTRESWKNLNHYLDPALRWPSLVAR